MKSIRLLGISLLALLVFAGIAIAQEPFTPGKWTVMKDAPSEDTTKPAPAFAHIMLLSDGSVLAFTDFCAKTGAAMRLVPDSTGSYVNGTWVKAGTLPTGYSPLYFGSEVLPNGQVTVIGGEYIACSAVWSNGAAIYNPDTNTWATLAVPSGWTEIGDAQSVILPNGHLMQAACCTKDAAILTLTNGVANWTPTGTGKADVNDEEGWTLLPDGNLLTVDAYVFKSGTTGMNSEIYDTAKGTWSGAGSTKVQLWDSATGCDANASHEVGPAVLRPDGTVYATGANSCGPGHTAIYNTKTKTWTAGPDFPSMLDIADGPASLLPDGNVLLETSPGYGDTGAVFFEWDGTKLNETAAPAHAAVSTSYAGDMVILPTGQVLFSNQGPTLQVYTPAGKACSTCIPTIATVASTLTHGSKNNKMTGTLFNGVSQGAAYGDDNQSNTNFPIVRITDSNGAVVYCKTHGWLGGVATGSKIVSTQFDIPESIAIGAATIEVVANGIPSAAASVTID
jgi:hypothetical protein